MFLFGNAKPKGKKGVLVQTNVTATICTYENISAQRFQHAKPKINLDSPQCVEKFNLHLLGLVDMLLDLQ